MEEPVRQNREAVIGKVISQDIDLQSLNLVAKPPNISRPLQNNE
jgi:hypothetical protein